MSPHTLETSTYVGAWYLHKSHNIQNMQRYS